MTEKLLTGTLSLNTTNQKNVSFEQNQGLLIKHVCLGLNSVQSDRRGKTKTIYRNVPKFSDRQIWTNSANPDQTAPNLIRVFTVCNSLCIFWMHYSKEKPSCSTFRVITANFRESEILGVLWYSRHTIE